MNIFRYKLRYSRSTTWVMAKDDGSVWDTYRSLKSAKADAVRNRFKATRRIDMDFKTAVKF
jgi:hypothetical protein